MKITAIDSKTGKVILTQTGVSKDAFAKTLSNGFSHIGDITIINDGELEAKTNRNSRNGNSVVWKGSFTDLGGYANMNREISFRLLQRGYSVKLDMLRTAPQADTSTISMLNTLAHTKIRNEETCPLVVGFTPMPVRMNGRRVVFYTMMETQGLHREFIDRCNKFASEIWVPCKFYVDVFRNSGIIKPTFLMPLGVNHQIYTPDAIPPNLRYEEMPSGKIVEELPNGFRFISLFGWSYRKGPDVLCRSFLSEFSGVEDAHLVIYSRYMGGSGEPQKEHVRAEIRQYYSEIQNEFPGKIYYCGDSIPIQDLPGCFASANCFIFCSRGEGFGLPVIEAGACGIPVISSYNTAMTQYLDDDVAFLVRPDEYAAANDKLTWITEFYRDQQFPVLGPKSIAEFATHMRTVFQDKEEAQKRAIRFRERILSYYTWDKCADRVVSRLKTSV